MTAFIDDHRDRFGVEPICRVLTGHGCKIAPSTYYAAKSRPLSARAQRDAVVLGHIRRVHGDPRIGRGLYGARKVWHELRREQARGEHRELGSVPRCQIERLMRANNIRGTRRDKGLITTRSQRAAARPADLVKRNFTASRPNELWVVDFTYVPTWSHMAFSAFVSDVYSRRIVGWRTAAAMPTQLPLDAPQMALWTRQQADELVAGLIHHTDKGSQGGFNRWSQHLEVEVSDGTTARLDGDVDGEAGDAVAGSSACSTRFGACVLGQDCRRSVERGRGDRVWRVGSGRVALVPRAWRDAVDPAQPSVGQVSLVR